MNVTEIVDHAAVRSIRHGLRHVEHDAVLLLPPYRARVEELGLVAVQACLCGIGTGWRCSIDQVLQLASPFYFRKFVAAPDRAVRTIWLIRKSERVHPIGGVALIEGDGLANAYVDRRRGAVKACEHVIARLRSEWVEADTERSFIRCAAIDRASGYRRVGGLGDKSDAQISTAMLSQRSRSEVRPIRVLDGGILGVAAKVVPELVDLVVLRVDDTPKNICQLAISGHTARFASTTTLSTNAPAAFIQCTCYRLARDLSQHQFGHVYCILMVRDHLLHEHGDDVI
mmetsp:Transcript_18571/g.44487  ORF Transcript_18571/g.44487 Transcript_18571/m.44487 type:complete len:285 (-) Transcript_18571:970-1824(-)